MEGVLGALADTSSKPTVLVYTSDFLTPTMTFVYRQILGVSAEWSPLVVTNRRTNGGLFPFSPVFEIGHTWASRNRARFHDRVLRGRIASIEGARARKIEAITQKARPRLIHAHFGLSGLEILPFAMKHGLPLLVTFHGYDASARLRKKGYCAQLRDLFRYAECIAVSRDMAQRLKSIGADDRRLHVHYIGVPLDVFEYRERESLREKSSSRRRIELLQVSSFVEKKGHEYTLSAYRRLLKDYPECRLTLGGDGPLRAHIESVSADLVQQGKVRFLGRLSEAAVAEAMGQADVFVHHSVTTSHGDREGLPTVLGEAMASGLIVVSTYHSGIPELVDNGVNGYLAQERDVADYADTLKRSLASGSEMNRAARTKVEACFNMQRQNRALARIYAKVARTPPSISEH
jgi:colanic acid/amylovoran biosynthesis glycosyltransferase